MVSHDICYKETCGFIFRETVHMFSYADALHVIYFQFFMILE